MKKTILVAWLLFVAAVLNGATPAEKTGRVTAAPPIEFVGYSAFSYNRLFVLHDSVARESSSWVKLGQTWRGYTLAAFDQKAGKLTLKKDEAELALTLRDTKVVNAAFLPALIQGTYTLQGETVAYSPEAVLKIGTGPLTGTSLSSPSGLMVSDIEQKIIGGDLTVEGARGTYHAEDATVNARTGTIRAKRIHVNMAGVPNDVQLEQIRFLFSNAWDRDETPPRKEAVNP